MARSFFSRWFWASVVMLAFFQFMAGGIDLYELLGVVLFFAPVFAWFSTRLDQDIREVVNIFERRR